MTIINILLYFIIIIPTFIQLNFGMKSIKKSIETKFSLIILTSFILQILLSILVFFVSSFDQLKETDENYRCNMMPKGIILFTILMFFILLIIISLQVGKKQNLKQKEKNNG